MIGKIKEYNSAKGFGFISHQDGNKDHFFHVSEIVEGYIPIVGDTVEYTEGSSKDGRLAAKGIRPVQ